ncbi:MAG: Hpt domain-containing protein [bacterium]|nr:Hpt domain-containing protein [bacterium]
MLGPVESGDQNASKEELPNKGPKSAARVTKTINGTDTSRYRIKASVSQRMRNVFLSDVEKKLATIDGIQKKEASAEDKKTLKLIAHGYRGNAEYFGLTVLTAAAGELEQAVLYEAPLGNIIALVKSIEGVLKEILNRNKPV